MMVVPQNILVLIVTTFGFLQTREIEWDAWACDDNEGLAMHVTTTAISSCSLLTNMN